MEANWTVSWPIVAVCVQSMIFGQNMIFFFTAVIVLLYLIIVHVVRAACLMKETGTAPGRVAHKNRCLVCLILDRGFNTGICSYLLQNEA